MKNNLGLVLGAVLLAHTSNSVSSGVQTVKSSTNDIISPAQTICTKQHPLSLGQEYQELTQGEYNSLSDNNKAVCDMRDKISDLKLHLEAFSAYHISLVYYGEKSEYDFSIIENGINNKVKYFNLILAELLKGKNLDINFELDENIRNQINLLIKQNQKHS